MKQYFVYIMASRSRTLYTGVTSDLTRRVWEHKHRAKGGFTAQYKTGCLVYFESTPNVRAAIAREKQIKGWLRSRKMTLVESVNPTWEDLAPNNDSSPSMVSV